MWLAHRVVHPLLRIALDLVGWSLIGIFFCGDPPQRTFTEKLLAVCFLAWLVFGMTSHIARYKIR
jgi:hypothetical protein